MKQNNNVLIVSLSVILAANTNAAPTPSHWYLGVDAGQGYYSNGGNPQSNSSDRHDVTAGAHLGYQLNPFVSAELAYQYLGEAKARYGTEIDTAKFHQSTLSMSFGYPLLNGHLTPYMKLGGSGWSGDIVQMGSKLDVTGFSPLYGAGLSLSLSDSFRLRLEHQITENIGNENSQYADHHLTTFGVSWRFGFSSKSVSSEASSREVTANATASVQEKSEIGDTLNPTITGYQAWFEHNAHNLSNPSVLIPVIDALDAVPSATASITGHTDNTGTAQYNLKLSQKRAQSVKKHLIENGISPNRLEVYGKGMSAPIADNQNAEGRALNRRVEIQLTRD